MPTWKMIKKTKEIVHKGIRNKKKSRLRRANPPKQSKTMLILIKRRPKGGEFFNPKKIRRPSGGVFYMI